MLNSKDTSIDLAMFAKKQSGGKKNRSLYKKQWYQQGEHKKQVSEYNKKYYELHKKNAKK
jgi:hypothetical protein